MSKSHDDHGIGMSNAAAAGRIEEDYAHSRPYQHNLEIVRNALQQPGTTCVKVDIWKMPETGALKRVTFNNGPSMPEAEMRAYMGMIGAGKGDLWRLDNTLGNRHAGARSAVLPFTDLEVLSWDDVAAPDGIMMTLYWDPDTHEYRFTEVSAPPPALLALLTAEDEVKDAGHGMAFIYVGRDPSVDGPFADPNPLKGETAYGVIDAMRDRIYAPLGTVGNSIKLIVHAPMPVSVSKAAGGRKLVGVDGSAWRLDGRQITGYESWLQRPECVSGVVVVDDELDVRVRWALLPHDTRTARHLPFNGKGHIVARYKNESMVIAASGGAYDDLSRTMRLFGVQLADVYQNLGLLIEGPTDPGDDPSSPKMHLHQDPSRSRLVLNNGNDLPLNEWGTKFIERMPEAVADANKAARERLGGRASLKFSTGDRLKERLGSRLKAVIQSRVRKAGSGVLGPAGSAGSDYLAGMVNATELLPIGSPSGQGQEGVTPGGSGKGGKTQTKGATKRARIQPVGTSTTRRRVPGGEAATSVKPRPSPVPEPVPISAADWIKQGFDPEDLASWDHAQAVVYFNLGHDLFHEQVSFFTGQWLERHPKLFNRVDAEEVRNVVYEAYYEDVIARVMHCVAGFGLPRAKGDLTNRALTIAAYGFENVQAKIESLVRAKADRGVLKSGAAA